MFAPVYILANPDSEMVASPNFLHKPDKKCCTHRTNYIYFSPVLYGKVLIKKVVKDRIIADKMQAGRPDTQLVPSV